MLSCKLFLSKSELEIDIVALGVKKSFFTNHQQIPQQECHQRHPTQMRVVKYSVNKVVMFLVVTRNFKE